LTSQAVEQTFVRGVGPMMTVAEVEPIVVEPWMRLESRTMVRVERGRKGRVRERSESLSPKDGSRRQGRDDGTNEREHR